jgi:ABC-2 type transport system permease protein
MSISTLSVTLRQRIVSIASSALGMILVILMVGALFPAVGDSIGQLDLPDGVTELLGGADYGTLSGWMRSEIGAVYGPLVIAAIAISVAAGSTAGEEEDGILSLVLAHPITRGRLVLSKAAAMVIAVGLIALATFAGLVLGVAVGGGGVATGHLLALGVHLFFFGWAMGALALAVAAATGRRGVAVATAAAVGVLAFLVNGFAPLVGGLEWLKYLSPFYFYAGHDPIGNGVNAGDIALLGAAAIVFTAAAVVGIGRRDLRH